MNEATLKLEFSSADEAQRAGAALEPDNGDHCTMHVEGATLVVIASDAGARSLLRTLDDVLSCLRATGIE